MTKTIFTVATAVYDEIVDFERAARHEGAEEMRERCNEIAVAVYQRHHENGNYGWAGVAEEIAREISALEVT